ncbi:MAG: substrate-binding domain-containing protein [Terracidiphilus sp.]
MPKLKPKRLYLVPILSKALDIQEVVERAQDPLTLEAIYKAANCPKTTAYRILKTYVHRGYIAQSQDGLYRISSKRKKIRFGFAAQSSEMPFSEAVTESLKKAALANGIELLLLDNHYDSQTAVANAERMVMEKVDLAIDFQMDLSVTPKIGDLISSAGIPMIAVDLPHPHATYFGADNYRIGFSAGEVLAQQAIASWAGKVSWVLGLDVDQAGPFVANRTIGAFDAIRRQLPEIPQEFYSRADSDGQRAKGYRIVLDFLRRHPKEKGILIVAHNDVVALGAVQAVREQRRQKQVMIVGQDCIPEAIKEMARADSPLIGSIATAAESYGPQLVALGLAILRGQAISPYNFTQHEVVTRESLSRGKQEAIAKA